MKIFLHVLVVNLTKLSNGRLRRAMHRKPSLIAQCIDFASYFTVEMQAKPGSVSFFLLAETFAQMTAFPLH